MSTHENKYTTRAIASGERGYEFFPNAEEIKEAIFFLSPSENMKLKRDFRGKINK